MSFEEKVRNLGWPLDENGNPQSRFGGPMIIGHRGACFHAVENTLAAFELASTLGADMWELDVRNTADGFCVVSHDDDLSRTFGVEARISELTLKELQSFVDVEVPTFQEVVLLAKHLGTGLYVEIKGEGSNMSAWKILEQEGYPFASMGSFYPHHVAELAERNCPYPLSVLARLGDDPFEMARHAKADIIHPCWERASERPDSLLTDELFEQAKQEKLPIVLWHEERPDVIKTVMKMDVLGVCSDRPELLVPYASSPSRPSGLPKGPEIVCHRGINKLAPENTIAAAKLVFEQGFDWLELDTHETADGHLIVMHDDNLDRTSNGTGPIAEKSLAELRALDAGGWFGPKFSGEPIPTLAELIDLAKAWNKKIYIEIKHANPQTVLDLVKEKDFLKNCFFWSYGWDQIEELARLDPEVQIMARKSDYPTISDLFKAVSPYVVEIGYGEEAPDQMREIRQNGAKAMICYMGEDATIFERIKDLKPDMVNLNHSHVWKDVWHHACRAETGKAQAE
ncbi:glycerophosphodiester phosphodiesterase family protein [uncultured Cohaesibacter sp.]|uniref:glycerophosphodiester phosphodiesterase n=1 Tax=uncultured Cohaesibacter sp. TaxID=1002546 RepID=UPI00292D39F0|nr:glycerophosphodiester phosphodiesterase family protein [uncultured Cohaesibacter sp.]